MMPRGEGRARGLSPVIWFGALALWGLPLVAMQFTREVAWGVEDFAVFGLMLVCAVAAYEIVRRMTGRAVYRALLGLVIMAVFGLVWAQLAVGIF